MVNPLVPVNAHAMKKNNFNPLQFMTSQFVQQPLRFTAPCLSCMYVQRRNGGEQFDKLRHRTSLPRKLLASVSLAKRHHAESDV